MRLRRGVAALLACLVTSVVVLVATQLPASADPQPNYPELLVNIGSDKCFEPIAQYGHTDWDGLLIQQRTCNIGNTLESFTFQPLGYVLFNEGPPWWCINCIHLGAPGYFIVDQDTGKCLDARDGATNDRSVIQQWTCRDVNARSMVWYTEPGDYPGAWKIRNFNSDLCIDVAGGSSADFAQIQQYHCTSNNPAQNFRQALFP